MKKVLNIVVPCYNEEEVLFDSAAKLSNKLKNLISKNKVSGKSRIIFVDDGSSDSTWQIIEKLNKKDEIFGGIKLSRNQGHQNALLAGLFEVKNECDFTISIDADLQDDIEVFDKMIDEFYSGAEIVYGVRDDRATDTFFKRNTALLFYRIMNKLGVESVYNHADFRLMSSKSIEELSKFKEVNLFLRGIVPLIGFKTANVKYARKQREAGESKYPLKKMINFAIDGVTSFSIKPIRMIVSVGFFVSLLSVAILIYALVMFLSGKTVSGWTFIVFSIWLLGGIQTLAIGIIGEYIGKTYFEVKSRPRFIIEEKL